jgi:hypothetical protein
LTILFHSYDMNVLAAGVGCYAVPLPDALFKNLLFLVTGSVAPPAIAA